MLVVPTCQHARLDLVRMGDTVEGEKDRLLEQVGVLSLPRLLVLMCIRVYVDSCGCAEDWRGGVRGKKVGQVRGREGETHAFADRRWYTCIILVRAHGEGAKVGYAVCVDARKV